MRIGVDACCWSNRRGFGRFTRELLGALVAEGGHDYVFFADRATADAATFPAGAEAVAVETSEVPTDAASAQGRRSLGDVWAMTRAVARHDLDLVFFPAVYSYVPVLNRARVVVTIHDVIADRHPEATFPNKRLLAFWKAKQRLALFQADRVLTVSEASKAALCDYFGLVPDRVGVATEAASDTFRPITPGPETAAVLARASVSPDERFVLAVGGISPHKNLGALVDAVAGLAETPATADVRLVLVGDHQGDAFHSDYARLAAQVEALGLGDRVVFTGFVPDADLAHWYNAAAVLAFPSLDEGFGLPAVEAMQCGTPVVASDRGSLPEVLGDAGRFFDPTDPDAICRALREVLEGEGVADAMRRRGIERARQFTWAEAARRTRRVFEETR